MKEIPIEPLTKPFPGHTGMPFACSTCEARSASICNGLAPPEFDQMTRYLTQHALAARAPLCSEGDAAKLVYTVTAGSLRLFQLLPDGRRQIVGFAFPGDFLGLTSGGLYNVSAEALEDSRVCQLPRAEFTRLMQVIPDLEHRVLARTAAELVRAREQMVLLGRKTAGERLATFLLQMAARMKPARPDMPLRLPMTRADIADYLGLTTETVSRTFTRLRALKLIELPGNDEVRLLRPELLEGIASGKRGNTRSP